MKKLKLAGFTIITVPESEQFPMQIVFDNGNPVIIDLPNTGAFHHHSMESTEHHSVMFKMDNSTKRPPEVSFIMSNSELEQLQSISVLPVIG
ncbi:hypothetical protein [Vibrio tritonius]|uniref:hypothetical protein n=1 Tax=Vibrio tritonius TaxID=1435069 RepID=UPI00315D0D82